jgi:hypothetical protein
METINTILGNTKSIMKNMSDTLQEIKNSVIEIKNYVNERTIRKSSLGVLEGEEFPPKPNLISRRILE